MKKLNKPNTKTKNKNTEIKKVNTLCDNADTQKHKEQLSEHKIINTLTNTYQNLLASDKFSKFSHFGEKLQLEESTGVWLDLNGWTRSKPSQNVDDDDDDDDVDDDDDDDDDDGCSLFYLRPFYLPSLLPTNSR